MLTLVLFFSVSIQLTLILFVYLPAQKHIAYKEASTVDRSQLIENSITAQLEEQVTKRMQKSRQLQTKIEEKRAELRNLTEIRNYSDMLKNQLVELEDKLDGMVQGSESVALVLSNWQTVMKSVSLASLGLYKYTENDYEDLNPLPEGLVRINLDKDSVKRDEEAQEEAQDI